MVVVSGTWMKHVGTYPASTVSDNLVIQTNTQNMAAKAILICRPNSHPFQDRTLILDQLVKVGRSVARAKPAANNAVFDCKVLSRHHAQLWYQNGKFFLQDTKSSNGTFVNNTRLTPETEHHELSSGDIVQFGVDVIENNRKVTHGCIIATLKLYLPDGKEAKASPSIMEGDGHTVVPLEELYTLNEIIQEANRRERCLESKLSELQHVMEETKRSADESWQAYIGEERLLSRLSTLETQLQQLGKGWTESKLREEIGKLRESNEAYQEAAKTTLEKVYAEKMEAVSMALEQERAKLSAEEDAAIARDLLGKAQTELRDVAHKLSQLEQKYSRDKAEAANKIRELEITLKEEEGRMLEKMCNMMINTNDNFERLSDPLIFDEGKTKEEILAENEMSESILNNSNDVESNHICLTVAPVLEKVETEKLEEQDAKESSSDESNSTQKSESKSVSFKLEEEWNDTDESQNEPKGIPDTDEDYDHIDSKTLKYQFQSAQNELKKKIECLESISKSNKQRISDLERELNEEKEMSKERLAQNENLKQELGVLEQKWKVSCNECQQLRDRVNLLLVELDEANKKASEEKEEQREPAEDHNKTISTSLITYDQLVNLEEELVLLKVRFREVSEDKVKLQRDLSKMKEQYNVVCNNTYNKYFFYIAPLVLMILYLLISAMIS